MSHPRRPLLVGLLLTILASLALVPLAGALAASPAVESRTWVVDAVDDLYGNRWVAEDTGTAEVVIGVGDTVEWQFDRAAIDHDLTSSDERSTWSTSISAYRVPHGEPIRHTFTEPGTYAYLCSIHGTLMHGTVVVLEAGANRAPVIDPEVDPTSGPAPLLVHATAHATDPDGDPLTYAWDFGTGDDASDTSTAAHAMYSYLEPGTYTATLTVSDGRGGVASRQVPIDVAGSAGVSATATPPSGTAPLDVVFAAGADRPGLTYAWEYGDGASGAGSAAAHTYTDPGAYTATVTASDADGVVGTDTVDIAVTDDGLADLPAITARATPGSGAAPVAVAFSTDVTTTGAVEPFSEGLTTYPGLTGTTELVRRRGSTYASIEVAGLKPGGAHLVHVHERACSDTSAGAPAGAHFRFDETQPFAEANELWLPFTADAEGASGLVEVTQPLRAGAKAVSVVVHDPDNPAKRIGCADLAPSTADLAYAWNFGDGATATGPDPDHTYARAGRFTATVTVSSVHAGHQMGLDGSVSASVAVVVADASAPDTRIVGGPTGAVGSPSATVRFASEPGARFACRLDDRAWAACASPVTLRRLADGRHRLQVRATDAAGNIDSTPAVRAWTVDTTGPRVRAVRPRSTRDRTPTLQATVTDRLSAVRRVVVRVDGRRAPVRYDDGRLVASPRRLAAGRHTVRVVAADAVGNRTVRTWRLTVRR